MVLTLSKVWVNLLSTGVAVSAQSAPGRTQAFTTGVEVRTYASGRQRAISAVGERGELPFTLVATSVGTRDTLRSWVGQAVQVRDHRGQKWFGTYAGVTVSEYQQTDLYAVAFTLLLTSVVEGV